MEIDVTRDEAWGDNRDAEEWRSEAAEKCYAFERTEEHRHAWLDHHRRQAAVFEALAAEHRETLFELMDLAAKRA